MYEEWSVINRILGGDDNALQDSIQSPNLDVHVRDPMQSDDAGKGDTVDTSGMLDANLSIPGIDKRALQQAYPSSAEDGPALLLLSPTSIPMPCCQHTSRRSQGSKR